MKITVRRSVAAVLVLFAFVGIATAVLVSGADPAERQVYTPARTPDGHPDLQGIWQVLNAANVSIQDHHASTDGGGGAGVVEGNEIPYQPWALARKKANFEQRHQLDPERKCYLPGVPRATYMPFPFQILQTPGMVAILYEYVHAQRRIYTDGTPHQEEVEFWMGDSRGKWEGNTLVVEVTNHNGMTWFDRAGNFHSDALKVVERYTRVDRDHIDYEATIEDPKVFTRPWKMRMLLYRRAEPNAQILDHQCYAFEEVVKGLSVPLARESTLK
jgi:hypothetical protein